MPKIAKSSLEIWNRVQTPTATWIGARLGDVFFMRPQGQDYLMVSSNPGMAGVLGGFSTRGEPRDVDYVVSLLERFALVAEDEPLPEPPVDEREREVERVAEVAEAPTASDLAAPSDLSENEVVKRINALIAESKTDDEDEGGST